MTYCPPSQPQTYEFTAIAGTDLLSDGDTNLGCGDSFDMPLSATVCITVTDNDTTLSGDAHRNELGDDRSYQTADIEMDGSLLHDGVKIYAEEYYVVQDADGNCYHLVEIETACSSSSDLADFYAFVGDVPPAGATLTVVGKGNVCGNWIDYRDLSAGLKWEFDDDGKLTVEAEDMALRGYMVDDVNAASGGEVIRLKNNEGTASLAFGGESGTYDLALAYIDECDGCGEIEVWVRDTLIHSIALTANNNGNGNDWSSISTVEIHDVALNAGDEITLKGTRDAWEFARIDSLTFCAQDNTPPEANDDFYTVGEESMTVLDILSNDFDPDGDTLSFVLLDGPAEGSLSINGDGDVVFETAGAFSTLSDGQEAQVSFMYEISDGQETDIATVTVTITGEGECPDTVVTEQAVTMLPSGQAITVGFDAPAEICDDAADFGINVAFGDLVEDRYNFIFTVDVSGSTGLADSFGPGQTVLDAEVAALKSLAQEIVDLNIPAGQVSLSIIPFSDPATAGGLFPVFTFGDDELLDMTDVNSVLDALVAAGETNYLAAIGQTTQTLLDLESSLGDANNTVYYLSDGDPTPPGSQPPFLLEFFSSQMQAEADVHAIGLGTDVSTIYLDPLDNTGGAEIVLDTTALDAALGQAPAPASTILSASLTFTDDAGAVLDTLLFTGDDFDETPLGYQLDVENVAGLGKIVGDVTTGTLLVELDEDGDLVSDATVSIDLDMAGILPESTTVF